MHHLADILVALMAAYAASQRLTELRHLLQVLPQQPAQTDEIARLNAVLAQPDGMDQLVLLWSTHAGIRDC